MPQLGKMSLVRASAQAAYRDFCAGEPGKEGAIAYTVKTLAFKGMEVTATKVKSWQKMDRWDEQVENIDKPAQAAVEALQKPAPAEMPVDVARDMLALQSAVADLTLLARSMIQQTGALMQSITIAEPADVLNMAKTAALLVDTSIKARQALNTLTPEAAKVIEAQAVAAPPALAAAPTLAGVAAQYERAAREGKKH